MTDLDLSGLEDLVTGKPTSRSTKAPWQPLNLDRLHPGAWLGCDQSLKASGLVVLLVDDWPEWTIRVTSATTIGTQAEAGIDGWEDVLRRARKLEREFRIWIPGAWRELGFEPRVKRYAAHEAPPIGGGSRFLKPELSLIASYAFRRSLEDIFAWQLQPMVRPQDHKSLICGNANAKKPAHHHALKQLFPRIEGSELITNEATRDALSVALTAAYRGPKTHG